MAQPAAQASLRATTIPAAQPILFQHVDCYEIRLGRQNWIQCVQCTVRRRAALGADDAEGNQVDDEGGNEAASVGENTECPAEFHVFMEPPLE